MYFKVLKYVVLLAALSIPAGAAETLVVPPLFEDFPGPEAVSLRRFPLRGGWSSCWKIETLVHASELGRGPLVLRRIGFRVDEASGPGPHRVRGSVTLSTTRSGRLAARFAENATGSPITFFVASRSEGTRAGEGGERLWLDLPGGFRIDPAIEGNLLVHLELEAVGETLLDAAPAAQPRLVVASDFLSPSGELRAAALVLLFGVERELPPGADDIGRVVIRPVPPARHGQPPSASASATAVPAALVAELRSLRDRVASLEAELGEVKAREQGLRATIENELPPLRAMVTAHYLESALASGRPGALLLAPARDGGQLEAAREVVVQTLAAAGGSGLGVGAATRLIGEGDLRLARGELGLAFLSWSQAFRSLLSEGRPWEALPPRLDLGEHRAAVVNADLGRRRAPYDFAW